MKAFLIVFVFLFFSSHITKAQNDTILSQLSELGDTAQVNLLGNTINSVLFQDPNLAMMYLEKYSKLPLVIASKKRQCFILTSKGIIYEMLGNYALALEYDFKALKLAEEIHDSVNIANSYANIGFVYSGQSKQYRKQIEYLRKALEIWKLLKNNKRISRSYSNIANAFNSLRNSDTINQYLDSAMYYERISIRYFNLVKDSGFYHERDVALKYSGLSNLLLSSNKLDSALYYDALAIEILERLSLDFELAEVYYGVGFIYEKKKNHQLSEKYMNKAIEKAEKLNLTNHLIKYRFMLARIVSRSDNYPRAYKILSKLVIFADSANSNETIKKIAEVQAQYDNEKHKRKIEKLEFESQVQKLTERNYILSIIAIIIIAIIVFVMLILKKRKDKVLTKQKEQLYEQKLKLASVEQEKSNIKEQELENELKFKNKELTTHALNMMQKNKLLDNLLERIDGFKKVASLEQKEEIRKIKREINNYLRSDKDWELFKIYFEKVNESFFDDLKQYSPELSVNDLRLCALIKLDMNIKESATVLNVAPNTIKSARYRLRKKLQLDTNTYLYEFLQDF